MDFLKHKSINAASAEVAFFKLGNFKDVWASAPECRELKCTKFNVAKCEKH